MAAKWKFKQTESRAKPKRTSQNQSGSMPEQYNSGLFTPDLAAAPRLEAGRKRKKSKLVQQSRDREFEISYKQTLQAAEQGKKWAIVELGAYAEYQHNYGRAIEQYEKLAVQGDRYYMRRIAVIYEQSLEDINSAIDWYSEAGYYGDEYSMIRAGNLLELYFDDYNEAIAWYRKAAHIDSLPAIYHLCRIYQHNLNDFGMAVEWYKRAVQLGDLKAAVALGQCYENILKDYPKAVEWYSMAASQKSLYAINLLCQLYETKLGDYPRAIEWYKQAITLYNEQSSAEEVVAADSQGQQSMNSAGLYTPDAPADMMAAGVMAAAGAITPGMTAQSAMDREHQYAASQVDEFDEGVLPHHDDLPPAEIASALPDLHNEAEIEFLS